MQLTKEDLKKAIDKAWNQAIQTPIDCNVTPDKRAQIVHSTRSKEWVNCLAKEFDRTFSDRNGYRVFWKGNGCNRASFIKNEFLFDVMVARISDLESLHGKSNRLKYITACEWAIESELNTTDSRQIIVDMSKLVLAAAKNKLFVASHRSDDLENKILAQCGKIAKCCSGKVYFCFIDHPREWQNEPDLPCLYEWKKDHGWIS